MDRFVNKKIEKQTIYEIYRACRLCGAGGGYKMPIIQNVVNLDNCDVELKQKIRECVQIEVHQNDKMPPLICELCVDKVNDFYEFLEMCRQTNKRTRLKLGLPPQMLPRGAPDAGDCILGVTEPIFVNDEDSNEPLTEKRSKAKKHVRVKVEKPPAREPRTSRYRVHTPSPPRLRGSRRSDPENVTLSRLQTNTKKSISASPKSILKKGKKPEPNGQSPGARLKRSREPDVKHDTPPKRVKIALKPVSARPKVPPRQLPRDEGRQHLHTRCEVCGGMFKTPQAMLSHRRTHVTYTSPKHIEKDKCVEWGKQADVRCEGCLRTFPTRSLLGKHRCPAVAARPGKCTKCGKNYASKKSLATHTRYCRKGDVVIPLELRRRLRPLQVRVARCDPLLARVTAEHYDVGGVPANYGLDTRCVYPYLAPRVRIKTEPSDCMVKINDMDFGSYVHWDSDDSGDSDAELENFDRFTRHRKVNSLAACALKTIFSDKLLGKVPRKFRRLKIESIIESTLNDSLSDLNLNDSETVKYDEGVKVDDEDDLFPKTNSDEVVTNDDFDSLFNDSKTDGGSAGADCGDTLDLDSGLDNGNNDSVNGSITNSVSADGAIENGENCADKSLDSADVQLENQSQDTNDCENELLRTDLNGDEREMTEDDEKAITEDEKRITEDETKASETLVENHNGNGTDLDEERQESCKSETRARVDIGAKPEIEYPNDKDECKRDVENNVDEEKKFGSQENGEADIDDITINMNDLEDMSGTEYDDCDLMAEIDAQIGEKKREVEKETGELKKSGKTDVDEEKKDVDNGGAQKRIGSKTEGNPIVNEKEYVNKQDRIGSLNEDDRSMDLESISDDEFDVNI